MFSKRQMAELEEIANTLGIPEEEAERLGIGQVELKIEIIGRPKEEKIEKEELEPDTLD